MRSSSRCLAASVALACLSLTIQNARAHEVRSVDIRRPVSLAGAERTYWLASAASDAEALAFREALLAAGARNVNLFVPDMVIVCDVPPAVAREVQAVGAKTAFRARGAKSLRALVPSGSSSDWIEEAYALAEQGDGAEAPATDTSDPDAFRDVVMTLSPERVDEIQRTIDNARVRDATGTFSPAARKLNQNSEFLGGYILANYVYPESNGLRDPNFENWSDEDLRQAKAGSTAAFLSWQGKFPNMDIGFVIHHFERIATGYEPITHDMGSDGRWILDAMRTMGWGTNSDEAPAAVHEFNESERVRWHAQWVVTSFIACSRNTPNNRFKSGNAPYTAYAYLGGPYMVEPFPAGTDINGVGETLVYSQIVNHEIGHLFWTLDEYPGSPAVCATRSGYLDVDNGNVTMTGPDGEQSRCTPHVPCIMHTAARTNQNRPWCDWSHGHLGVLDGNGNAVPDIFEAEPVITFFPEGPETVTTNSYTLRFTARATAVDNMNPNQGLNRVSYALPLDDGKLVFGTLQLGLDPVDGSWNEIEEEVEFTLAIAQTGIAMLNVQVENNAGFRSRLATKMVYFAGVRYDRLVAVPKWNRIDLSWETPGETFGAKFDVYRLEQGDAMPGMLLAQNVAPNRIGPLGQPVFLLQDFDITVGTDYRYYIEGVFDLPSEGGGTREFVSRSALVVQTAMVPVTDLVSDVAPNPTRDTVTFSVAVPKTFNETSQGPTRVPTDVDIRVYNVRGQLVRTLKTSSELNTVLTMRWDGTTQDGLQVPSGVYFLRVQAGEAEEVRKIVLLR